VPNASWIAVLVAFGELAIGLGLAFGFLTRTAAVASLLLLFTYVMSGTASVCAFYALCAIVVLATWRTSSWIGVDGLIAGYRDRRRDPPPFWRPQSWRAFQNSCRNIRTHSVPRNAVRPGGPRCCISRARGGDRPEIVGMFEADADAKQTGRHALFALPPASSIDRRLHAAQTRRANDELQGFDESIGGRGVGDVEGEHGTVTRHLCGCAFVTGIGDETG